MGETTLTPLDRQILEHIQSAFPVNPEPYAVLAGELGCQATDVHGCVRNMRATGLVRRIGGSFAAGPLGYVSTLVGARVTAAGLVAAATRAASWPEVTHNYEREGEYNLWFTVIAASEERLEHVLQSVRDVEGVESLYSLPSLRSFKIQVHFHFGDGAPPPSRHGAFVSSSPHPLPVLDSVDRRIICRTCGDLGDSQTPFAEMALEIGVEQTDLLARLASYRECGAMRRFGAILRHRSAGFGGNGMSGWNVPDADVVGVGEFLAGCPDISHCYERPRIPDWPYNVFGMIHGRDRDGCLAIAGRIARETGISDYHVLFSGREFKKTSMVYFPEALADNSGRRH